MPSLLKLSLAIYSEMLLRIITLAINTYMISKIDVNLVGALGAGNQIFMLFITIFSFLGVGCSVLVSQAIGAGNKNLALRAIHTSISFNFLLGLFSGIFVFVFAFDLLEILQVPPAVIADSEIYLKIISIAFMIDALAIIMSSLIRVYGFAKYIVILSVVMNIITLFGNYIALFEPFGLAYYGLFGVGISTIVGRVCGVIMFFIIAVKFARIRFYFPLFLNVKRDIITKILSVGLPSAGENLLWTAQYMVAFAFVASMGASSLSVQTIYFQISAFVFFGGSAVSMANEVIVGRLVGANKMEEAYNESFRALKFGLLATAAFLFVVFTLRYEIMGIFNFSDELIEIAKPLFYISLVLEFGRTLNIIFVNALRASGDARFPFFMGVIFMWGVSIQVGYFLGIYMGIGIAGVWLGFLCDECLRGVANAYRWKSKKWQNKKLV